MSLYKSSQRQKNKKTKKQRKKTSFTLTSASLIFSLCVERETSHPRSAERKRVTDGELSIVLPVCIFTESPDLPAQPFNGGELTESKQSSLLLSAACERPLALRWTWDKTDVKCPQNNMSSLKERRWWGGETVKEENTVLGQPASPEL